MLSTPRNGITVTEIYEISIEYSLKYTSLYTQFKLNVEHIGDKRYLMLYKLDPSIISYFAILLIHCIFN